MNVITNFFGTNRSPASIQICQSRDFCLLLEVHNEELVDRAEPVMRRIIEFCGLPWDDACLEFHKARRVVTTPSYDQVRRPIFRSSLGRARKFEKHLGPLKEALGLRA